MIGNIIRLEIILNLIVFCHFRNIKSISRYSSSICVMWTFNSDGGLHVNLTISFFYNIFGGKHLFLCRSSIIFWVSCIMSVWIIIVDKCWLKVYNLSILSKIISSLTVCSSTLIITFVCSLFHLSIWLLYRWFEQFVFWDYFCF